MATPYAFANPRLFTATLTSSTFFRPVKTELLHQPNSVTAESCASRASRWNSWQSMEQQVPRCSSSSSDTAGAKASGTTAAGQVQRLVLSNQGRSKLNPSSDRGFYSSPRLVTHVDDHFLANLSALYRARIPENAEILDLMSSWISHLPEKRKYKRVVGHGLNAVELARNSRLDHFFVKDLNAEPKLENADCSFDAVLCAVSVQYLEQPEKVFAEIFRVLRPGGVCIMSFSNRMFYEKAVSAWRDGSDYSRTQLVVQYFQCVAGFTQPEVIKQEP